MKSAGEISLSPERTGSGKMCKQLPLVAHQSICNSSAVNRSLPLQPMLFTRAMPPGLHPLFPLALGLQIPGLHERVWSHKQRGPRKVLHAKAACDSTAIDADLKRLRQREEAKQCDETPTGREPLRQR